VRRKSLPILPERQYPVSDDVLSPDPAEQFHRVATLVLTLILFGLLGVYLFQAASVFLVYQPGQEWPWFLWLIRNSIFLFIHEGGHALFMFFGRTLYALGGSFWQIMFPFLSFVLAVRSRSKVVAPFSLFWTGANMLDVSLYMRDAPVRVLPLLGRRKEGHDWHYLFGRLGLLDSAESIADLAYYAGLVICIGAIALGIFFAIQRFMTGSGRPRHMIVT
jgi:hypothetical protein